MRHDVIRSCNPVQAKSNQINVVCASGSVKALVTNLDQTSVQGPRESYLPTCSIGPIWPRSRAYLSISTATYFLKLDGNGYLRVCRRNVGSEQTDTGWSVP